MVSCLGLELCRQGARYLRVHGRHLTNFFIQLIITYTFTTRTPLSSTSLCFGPHFLTSSPRTITSLSHFRGKRRLPPKACHISVCLGGNCVTAHSIAFGANSDRRKVIPYLAHTRLTDVKLGATSITNVGLLTSSTYIPLAAVIRSTATRLSINRRQLGLAVPRTFVDGHTHNCVPPRL